MVPGFLCVFPGRPRAFNRDLPTAKEAHYSRAVTVPTCSQSRASNFSRARRTRLFLLHPDDHALFFAVLVTCLLLFRGVQVPAAEREGSLAERIFSRQQQCLEVWMDAGIRRIIRDRDVPPGARRFTLNLRIATERHAGQFSWSGKQWM